MTTLSPAPPLPATTVPRGDLPHWASVLVVVAHPDDEALGLGAVIDGFARKGADVTVLSLTPGARYTDSPVAGDLVPLHTGLGPDFRLAERAYED